MTSSDLQTGTQLTQDYMELIKSRTVLEEVISVLNLEMTTDDLKRYDYHNKYREYPYPDDTGRKRRSRIGAGNSRCPEGISKYQDQGNHGYRSGKHD